MIKFSGRQNLKFEQFQNLPEHNLKQTVYKITIMISGDQQHVSNSVSECKYFTVLITSFVRTM